VSQTVFARFDGKVLLPEEELRFPPNARLMLVIEAAPEAEGDDYLFLRTALEQNVDGPPDWSARVDESL